MGQETDPHTVLVVDDDDGLTSLIQKHLQRAGFQTASAATGAETISWVSANPADLMLLDLKLPDMSGQNVVQALAQKGASVPFVVITGQGDERVAVDMMKRGARDYIVKDGAFLDLLPSVVSHTFEQLEREARLKVAEAALRESEERFRSLFENAPLGYQSLDANGDFIEINETWCKVLGYTKEEVLGRNFSEFIHPDFREVFKESFPKFKSMGYILGVEFEMIKKDSSEIVVAFDGKIGYNDDGSFKQIHCVLSDITERKRAEQERRHLEAQVLHAQKLESLGVLAGGIAHDFNNLLVAILGNAELALMDLAPTSPARQSLAEIEKASHRAADLCRQMLAYSGKGRFVIEPLDLSDVVEEMAHMLEVSISKKALLRYDFARDLPPIEGDATQIRQVIMNLITNASDAIGDKSGVISVSSGAMACDRASLNGSYPAPRTGVDEDLPEGRYVYLEITDTGCGMDDRTLARVFDPFFTTKLTGRGLGLSAVLGIVRGHKGAIKFDSESGKGTTFKVLFPAAEVRATKREPRREQGAIESWRGSGTVLVVDDEESVLAVGKRMLEMMGFTVLTARDGREALEVFRERADEIVCVLLDLTMPHMDGEETLGEMRGIREDVRVILTSGYDEQEITERLTGKGLAGFVHKPYEAEALRAKMKQVLEG